MIGPLAGTMMACAEPVMALEGAFRAAFAGNVAYVLADGQLTVTGEAGVALTFEVEPKDTLDGAVWSVTGYNNGRQAVVSVAAGSTLTLAFKAGALSGHGGCNRYRTTYTVDGDRLTIGAPAATRMACPRPEVMEQEQRFFAALATVRTWRAQGGRLELRTETGALAVSARIQTEGTSPD
jgi:heat shock protein HslJ